MTRVRLELLQWFGLFGGALAWASQHVVGYGISDSGCGVAGRQWGLPVSTLQVVLGVVAGVITVAAWTAAFLAFRETRSVDHDAPGPAGRIHFFAQAGLLGNVLFLVIIVLAVVSTVYQLPCRPS
ncbi:MAG: hypothetical protein ACJ77E_16885 [Gaiellaceae bacterium]